MTSGHPCTRCTIRSTWHSIKAQADKICCSTWAIKFKSNFSSDEHPGARNTDGTILPSLLQGTQQISFESLLFAALLLLGPFLLLLVPERMDSVSCKGSNMFKPSTDPSFLMICAVSTIEYQGRAKRMHLLSHFPRQALTWGSSCSCSGRDLGLARSVGCNCIHTQT